MTSDRQKSIVSAIIITLSTVGFGCNTPNQHTTTVPPQKERKQSPAPITKKTIFLTFDADMTPAMRRRLEEKRVRIWYDPAIIDFLRQNDVPATIFVTGMFAELYPSFIADLAKDNRFSIQNHSYDHSGFEAPCYGLNQLKTDDERRAEITRTQTILQALTGKVPTQFRYPGLCKNAHDDALVAGLGLKMNDGNVISGDAFSHNAARIAQQVIDAAVDGSVVVMHLGGPNAPATAEALGIIVPALHAKGFDFAAMP